jgi:competence protein ComEC
VASGVLTWPLLLVWQGRGTVELVVIDVGQGDAIALRTPRGRWLLVDAGPAARDGDPRAHPAVRALRARGVSRLEALVLTHPDLDHIGGAASVLTALDVRAVYDPALPAPKEDFVEVLDVAAARGIPWRAAREGGRIELDGLLLEILHPPDSIPPETESNATSVVLRLEYGRFDALLTGDAYVDVERALLPKLPPLEVLKVGHHGSDTSTDSLLLAHTRPQVALISVGRTNRYGHPSPRVVARLERTGAEVRRTDLEGTLSIVAREDGRYEVRSERR